MSHRRAKLIRMEARKYMKTLTFAESDKKIFERLYGWFTANPGTERAKGMEAQEANVALMKKFWVCGELSYDDFGDPLPGVIKFNGACQMHLENAEHAKLVRVLGSLETVPYMSPMIVEAHEFLKGAETVEK
jgi:hypothetical protein